MICDDCIHKTVCAKVYSDDWCAFKQTTETINAVIIPDNATNGDMIKTLFPNLHIEESSIVLAFEGKLIYKNIKMQIDEEWWNAPYEIKQN